MADVSTRIWLDEELWTRLTDRAVAEGTTVRELLPRLVGVGLGGGLVEPAPARASGALPSPPSQHAPSSQPAPAGAAIPTPAAAAPAQHAGPPVIELAEVYQCGVCGGAVKVGGLTLHMGKHMKERQASEGERS